MNMGKYVTCRRKWNNVHKNSVFIFPE